MGIDLICITLLAVMLLQLQCCSLLCSDCPAGHSAMLITDLLDTVELSATAIVIAVAQ